MSTLFKLIFGILLIAVAVSVGPLLIIWSLNTLFPVVNIPYTWNTWCAAFFLSAPFTSMSFRKN